MKVGFIGMGRMGVPMAQNVLRGGHELTVYNRTRERCRPLAEAGASVAESPAELATGAEVVITMVADPPAARAVLTGPDGVVGALSAGSTVIEMSTTGPVAARELAAAAADCGVGFLDAPVSGSVAFAESAQLTAMVGGDAAALERVQPVLETMTKAHFHLGPCGAGAAMKLAVNGIIAVLNQSIAEALALAQAGGIELEDAYEVLKNSAIAAPYVHYREGAYLNPAGQPPGFTPDLMRKDLSLAFELAAEASVALPAAAAADLVLSIALGLGYGDEDMAVVAHVVRELSAIGSPG